MISFNVSKVKLGKFQPRKENSDLEALTQSIKNLVNVTPEASNANAAEVRPIQMHGFISAVCDAFAYHYPLILSPDDVWLCIAQGFANHVNANAEGLRKQFVQHEGKKLIRIECDGFQKGSNTNPWEQVFPQFSDKIAEDIGKKRDLVVCNFSTTNVVEKAASEIVLMDAMQQYFEYRCRTLCGIPEITLLGSVDDWKNIKARTLMFNEFGLKWWTDPLTDVLDKLIQSASGNPDVCFWESFFKRGGGSGGPYITGWINTLFPYISSYRGTLVKNRDAEKWEGGWGDGPNSDDFPVGLSKAPFIWEYYQQELPMQFLGGFVGTSQDSASLAIKPVIGWAVADAEQGASK